jgi:excisionase family DNA binding protein
MATAAKLVKMPEAPTTAPALAREWLSLRELTQYASVSERTLREWMHRKRNPLPAVQVEGKILVRRSAFDAWLERHRIEFKQTVDVDAIVSDLVGKLR